jgi:hypothetical protein
MSRTIWLIIAAVLAFLVFGSLLRLAGRLVNLVVLVILLLVAIYFVTRNRGQE